MEWGKKVKAVLCSVGILSNFFTVSGVSANTVENEPIVLTQDMGQQISNERLLINNDTALDNVTSMYHYSHTSHSSHYSHTSHSSHYSSIYE